jgi:hypothetical protein
VGWLLMLLLWSFVDRGLCWRDAEDDYWIQPCIDLLPFCSHYRLHSLAQCASRIITTPGQRLLCQ